MEYNSKTQYFLILKSCIIFLSDIHTEKQNRKTSKTYIIFVTYQIIDIVWLSGICKNIQGFKEPFKTEWWWSSYDWKQNEIFASESKIPKVPYFYRSEITKSSRDFIFHLVNIWHIFNYKLEHKITYHL